MAIMKWESRKGWNILLKAYLEEFYGERDVSLYIRANMDSKNRDEYQSFVDDMLAENSQWRKKLLPQVEFLRDPVPYTAMASLYKVRNPLLR